MIEAIDPIEANFRAFCSACAQEWIESRLRQAAVSGIISNRCEPEEESVRAVVEAIRPLMVYGVDPVEFKPYIAAKDGHTPENIALMTVHKLMDTQRELFCVVAPIPRRY